jgi:hypothetical protein
MSSALRASERVMVAPVALSVVLYGVRVGRRRKGPHVGSPVAEKRKEKD